MFFDDHPEFCETSETASSPHRLNMRHQAMIEANRDVLAGARVLDLASHDGRWSYAALEAGAAHVVGVEARPELVANAEKNFAEYGVDPGRYEFVCGDMFAVMNERDLAVDVVMCFGFIYHTLRYPDLFRGIKDAGPEHVLLDTRVIRSDRPLVELRVNKTGVQSNAVRDALSHRNKAITGWPSVPALEMILDVYDFEVAEHYDWASLLAAHPDIPAPAVKDYREGTRVSMRCRKVARRRPPRG